MVRLNVLGLGSVVNTEFRVQSSGSDELIETRFEGWRLRMLRVDEDGLRGLRGNLTNDGDRRVR